MQILLQNWSNYHDDNSQEAPSLQCRVIIAVGCSNNLKYVQLLSKPNKQREKQQLTPVNVVYLLYM